MKCQKSLIRDLYWLYLGQAADRHFCSTPVPECTNQIYVDFCLPYVCYQLFVLIFRLELRMEPIEMEVNLDWHTCFHGENLGDCHRNEVNNFCRYWHFIPTERREELVEKYKEIMGEKAPDTDFVHKFKNVKFEMEKILGLRL